MPSAHPDLEPASGEATEPPVPPRAPRALCLMTDGTWLLVWIDAWQMLDDGRWVCLIRWSLFGKMRERWFVHDPERLRPRAGTES